MQKQLRIPGLRKSEEGFILPIVLILFTVGVLLLTPALGYSYTGLKAGAATEKKAEELHAADAGVEDALNWLLQGAEADERYTYSGIGEVSRSPSLTLNDTLVDVVIQESGTYRRIESTSTSATGSTTIEAYVLVTTEGGEELSPSPFDYSVVTLDGNLEITGSSTISCEPPPVVGDPSTYQGNVWVNGDIELGWSTNIWGDATVSGTVNRPTNVKGTLTEGADPPARPVWLDEQVQDYIDNTLSDDPFTPNVIDNGTGQVHGAPHTLSCGTHTLTVTSPGTISVSVADAGVVTVQSGTATVTGSPVNLTAGDHLVTVQNSGTIVVVIGGAQYTGNVTMGWGTHGTYPARYVAGNLTISGTSGDGIYRFTGPVCVGGNLNIQSGVNRVIFEAPVKVGGYVYMQGNGTAVFEDTLRVGGYLRVGGSRSARFQGKVNVDGNLKASNRVLLIDGSQYSGADYDIVFEDTLRTTDPDPNTCYYMSFKSGRKYEFNDVVYTTEKAELAGNTGCEMEFMKALIAGCDVLTSGSSKIDAPPETSPLLVSLHGGVSLTGDVRVDAILYAPEGHAYVDGSSQLEGAVVSESAELAGNVVLKYPVLLRDRDDVHEGGGSTGAEGTTVTLVTYQVL